MLIAYFLLVMVGTQAWPAIFGPYTRDECYDVLELLIARQYDTSGCELLPLPQPDAVYVTVPFTP